MRCDWFIQYSALRIPRKLLHPPRRACPGTSQPAVTVHVTAEYLRTTTVLRFDVDPLELQPCAWCPFAAINSRRDIVSAGASDVLPRNVTDLEPTRIAISVAVDAWRDIYGLVDVLKIEIAEGNVAYVACAWISLDPSGIGRVNGREIFKKDIVDIIGNRRRVTKRPNDSSA